MRQSSPRAIVTSPHQPATEAGLAVLREGGTAFEAAIAVSAALAVSYPHFCGLGGDAVMLVAEPGQPPRCLSAIGQAPAAPEALPPGATRGPGSVRTTAALVDSWRLLLQLAEQNGSRPALPALLEPAIALAEQGFALTGSQAFWTGFRQPEAAGWPNFAATFLGPGAITPEAGTLFRQSDLGGTLRHIASHGPRSFYEGPLAQRLAEGLAQSGAGLSAADLAATRARFEAPIATLYRGARLWAPPPPTQGVSTLQIMAILDALGLENVPQGSAQHFHRVIEAIKRGFRDRGTIADPDFTAQNTAASLDPARIRALAAEISTRQALPWPEVFQEADTVYFGVIDREGRMVSALQSLYYDWGSGVVAGETGVLWQNRGAAFSEDPQHPNAIAPGKRPFYTLNPGLADLQGGGRLAYGTQGADGQPQTLAMILTHLLDYGATPEEALRAPRFLLGRTFSDSRDSLKLEADAEVGPELAQMGHEVSDIAAQSPLAGQAGVLWQSADGTVRGAHDPRSDGRALTLS